MTLQLLHFKISLYMRKIRFSFFQCSLNVSVAECYNKNEQVIAYRSNFRCGGLLHIFTVQQ
jgi:hypothetical protein